MSVNLEKSIAFIPNVKFWCKDPSSQTIFKTAATTGKSYVVTVKKGS